MAEKNFFLAPLALPIYF